MKKEKDSILQQFLDLSDKEFDEYCKSQEFFQNHWKLYSFFLSTTVNAMSLIESLLNDYITFYYIVSKDQHIDFVDTILTKINLREKYNIFIKLIGNMKSEESKSLYDKFKRIDTLINFRNLLVHGSLDDNFKTKSELENKKRIKLKYHSFNEKKSDNQYITFEVHRQNLDLFKEIYFELKIMLIQVFPQSTKLLNDKNNLDKEKYF